MTTLSHLLALPGLGLRLVQAGPGDPELSWVSITELLDLGRYLEGGEVILTTGLALGAEDARWHDFVAGLSRARIAAIGFGVGISHDALPPALVRAASAYRLALFEVPLPTPFIAVSKAAAELLRADELRAARTALGAGQRILDAASGERDPADILASIAQATGKQLGLVGTDGALIARTAGFPHRANDPSERIALDAEGSVHLVVAGADPLTPEGRSVIAAGVMVLGLELRGGRAEETRERERWERLAAGLLDGTLAPRSLAVLAPTLTPPERVRAVALRGDAERIADWRRRPRTGLDRLVAPGPTEPTGPTVPAGGGESPVFAAPDGTARARTAWQLCADADAGLERVLDAAAAHGLDAVVGRPTGLAQAPLSARSARLRLRALSRRETTAHRDPVVVWVDRAAPLLEAVLERTDRSGLVANVLGPLRRGAAPEAGGSAEAETLRDTLRAVFLADGQRGPAAAALGIHRNTLRDRITRIEGLTGRSLADADDRAELWLALRVDDLDAAG